MLTSEGMENKAITGKRSRGRPALPPGEKKVDAKIICKEKHVEAVRIAVKKVIEELEQ